MSGSGITFVVHPPPLEARDTVQAVWIASGHANGSFRADPVAPDGCVELIVNLGDAFAQPSDLGIEYQSPLLVIGQMTGPMLVGPTGRVDIVGIRLRPERSDLWLGGRAWALRDCAVPADEVLGAGVIDLADSLSRSRRTSARLDAIARYWVGRASRPAPCSSPVVDWVASRLRRSGGQRSIDELALRSGFSRRHLERLFRRQVGLTPKEYGRIVRVQRALRLLAGAPSGHGAAIAAACGFSDQPHMIRELRELAGVPPSQLDVSAFGPGLSTTATGAPADAGDREGVAAGTQRRY